MQDDPKFAGLLREAQADMQEHMRQSTLKTIERLRELDKLYEFAPQVIDGLNSLRSELQERRRQERRVLAGGARGFERRKQERRLAAV